MADSFFTGTDDHLYGASANFSKKISAEWAELGIPESMAIEYAALNAIYAASYTRAMAPATRTKGTVLAKNDAAAALRLLASRIAKLIDAVGATDAQKVGLGLNVRAKRSPMGVPGMPGNFSITLLALGWLELRWKCDQPTGARGTMYQIWRRIGDGPFEHLGSSGKKKFLDATIPAGSAQVTYKVQAVRSTKSGQAAEHTVSFGVRPGEYPPAMLPTLAA